MKRFLLALLLFAFPAALSAGELRLFHAFSDHAVLQQQTSVPVWGWGKPGGKVTLKASWTSEKFTARIGSDGSWRASVRTGSAGGPYTLTVTSGREKLEIQDVMLGEVWLCSGQSNMEMPMGGYGFQEIDGFREHLMEASEYAARIRVLQVKSDTTHVLQQDIDAVWAQADRDVFVWTSAVGYLFAKRLTRLLDVPVGIIVNAWGGSRIEPWMDAETVEKAPLTPADRKEIFALREHAGGWPHSVGTCWNGRMAPLAGYAVKGFLWYQGCSNIGQECYDILQDAMVRLWREKWGRGDLPFIYALLAPYSHGNADGRWRPYFVQIQMRAASLSPAVYPVCLETLGEKETIHPSHKGAVADMMALRALGSVYGRPVGIPIDYPTPREIDFQDDGRVRIRFHNVHGNLMSMTRRSVTGFELSGDDRVFHLAEAEVDHDGETVYVRCESVPHPVAVRYAYRNWMGANLETSYGIPVPPFRTDHWAY